MRQIVQVRLVALWLLPRTPVGFFWIHGKSLVERHGFQAKKYTN